MSLKTVIIIVFCSVIITVVITYFVMQKIIVYDPLSSHEVQNLKRETALKDSLNNEIINTLKMRIEDKQFIIDNVLQKQITESQNRVKYLTSKKDTELKRVNSLDEIELQKDINSKLSKRKN